MRRRFLSLPLLLAAFSLSCADVAVLEPNTCGNGVIDTGVGEDCDGQDVDGFPCRQLDQTSPCAFACTTEGACPAGYGCGTDDVCRRPSGLFESFSFAQATSQPEELLEGDFDDDRRADVVAVEPGHTRIHFFGDSGLVRQVSLPSSVRPSIGKLGALTPSLDGDEAGIDRTDDLALPLNLGIGALVSGGDQTFTAHTFGSILLDAPPQNGMPVTVTDALPLAFDALPDTLDLPHTGDETGALLAVPKLGPGAGEDGLFASFSTAGSGPVFRIIDGPPKSLSGPVVTAQLNDDPCQEIVFPRTGTGTLRVYRTCFFSPLKKGYEWLHTGTDDQALSGEIQLGAATIAGPVFAFDADSDSRPDLLITVATASGLELRVAYAVGDGSFHSTPAPSPLPDGFLGDNGTSPYALLASGSAKNGRVPLTLGDINQDGFPDIVDANQISLGYPTGAAPGVAALVAFIATYTSPRPWTEAVIADLNGNGYRDVVAASEGARDIDILNGNASSFFNPSQLATEGTVARLVVADFDGDVLPDIAFQNALSQGESQLMIAYGRTSAGPEEPLQIGTFPDILHMVSGSVHSFGVDNIADLGVLSPSAGKTLSISFFPGAGSRFMQAPFLLSNPETRNVHLPIQTGLGQLRAGSPDPTEEPHNDLAIIAFEPPEDKPGATDFDKLVDYTNALRLWGLFGAGEADFIATDAALCAMPEGAFFFRGLERATSVVVSGTEPGTAGRVFVGAPVMKFGGSAVLEIRGMLAEAELPGPGPCKVGEPFSGDVGELLFRVKTADLNGNGVPEILALRQTFDPDALVGFFAEGLTPSGGKFPDVLSSQVVVFWDGVLGHDGKLEPYVIAGNDSLVNDYAVADVDGDSAPDVFTVGAGGLFRYVLGLDGASLFGGPYGDIDLFGIKAMLIADVDGDGVDDLVAGASGLSFFRGIPRATSVVVADTAAR